MAIGTLSASCSTARATRSASFGNEVTTNASGLAEFDVAIPNGPITQITATATDPAGNTSELSRAVDVTYRLATTTTLAASPAASTFGQNVLFTATVLPPAGSSTSPSGTVRFRVDGTAFGEDVSVVSGQASMSTTALSIGTHQIEAEYSGDLNHQPSEATTPSYVVSPAPTTMTLTSSTPTLMSVFGQPVQFTATVSASVLHPPTGEVVFSVDGVPRPAAPLQQGVAIFQESSLAVGTHVIRAVYAGNWAHGAS